MDTQNQAPFFPGKTKKCKCCQKDIPYKATKCPFCFKKQPFNHPVIVAILALILVADFLWLPSAVKSDKERKANSQSDENIQNSATLSDDTQTGAFAPIPEEPEETVALAITGAYISENSIGTNLINITVTNSSEYTIDAFDYKVQSYNTYGEKLSNSLFDSFTKTDFEFPAGTSCTSSASLYWQDTATSFKVALTRYHIKDTGETVDIPSKERIWINVQK